MRDNKRATLTMAALSLAAAAGRRPRFPAAVVTLVIVTACIPAIRHPYDGPPPTVPPPPTAPDFRPTETVPPPDWAEPVPRTPEISVRPLRAEAGYRVFELAFPSSGDNRQDGNLVRARYYERETPGRRGVVFVIPIWGRSERPPALVTRRILRYGELDVIRFLHDRTLFDWDTIRDSPTPEAFRAEVQRSADTFAATVVDIRRLLDWTLERPTIDPSKVGIVGFSMSAMVSAVAAGLDGRFTHAVLYLASTDLAWIFSVCPHKTTGVREPVLARFGWTAEDFRRQITPILDPINPADLSGGLHPANVLFIEGANDTCMPEEAREELWHRLGEPERLTLRANHRNALLGLKFVDGFQVNRRIGEFLHREQPAPTSSSASSSVTSE